MTTFSCGVEEPLQPNEQLYAIDERTGAIGLAQFANSRLNRYSFVVQDGWSPDVELLAVVANIAMTLGNPASWLVAFLKAPAAGSPLRAQALVKRLAKQNWHIVEGAELYLATRPILFDVEQNFAPTGVDPVICGWAVLFGQPPNPESLIHSPLRETLRMLALTHRFQPSPEFLAACGQVERAVAYVAKDSGERSGLVVVSPRELSVLIRRMQHVGRIGSIFAGSEANRVWRG